MKFEMPSGNQLITLAIGLAILSFVAKLLPENIRSIFRV